MIAAILLQSMSQVIDARIDGNSRVFFIKGDRTAIVDTGAPGNERNILRALKVAGISRDQVSIIVITHAHWDHCGSTHALKESLNVPVMAGWPDAEFLEKGENAPVMNLPGKPESTRSSGPKVEAVKADVVVREDMSLDGYGIDAHVLLRPGTPRARYRSSPAMGIARPAIFSRACFQEPPRPLSRA